MSQCKASHWGNLDLFSISDLNVGNGVIGLMPVPHDEASVQDVNKWRPDLVLSLMEPDEFKTLACPDFLNGFEGQHLIFPVVDYGIPTLDQAALWQQTLKAAHGVLYTFGRVLIHCRGGCGRTGMVALRIMVEAGEDKTAALTRLRICRPCAIETQAQMDWACA